MIDKILAFFGENLPKLFVKYGWLPALIVIVVIVVLGVGTVIALRQWGLL